MDFSIKQALGVVVVIAMAALVITTAVTMTDGNNDKAKSKTNDMWNKADTTVPATPATPSTQG